MKSRRGKIRCLSYAAAFFAALAFALAACHFGAGGYTRRIDAQSTRAFGEAISAVERLDRSLQKCVFAADAPMESALCEQIYSDAQSAETALSSLPVELDALESISRHISVVGDYAYALSRAVAEGIAFPAKTMEQLSSFQNTTNSLLDSLSALREDLRDGKVKSEQFGRLLDSLGNLEIASEETAETLDSAFHALAQSFPEAIPVVYDGIYSDHSGEEAKQLADKAEVSQQTAKATAAKFLNLSEDALEVMDRSEGEIPCWRFHVLESDAVISVTVRGGMVMRYLSHQSETNDIDPEKASEAARAFLSLQGYPDMEVLESMPSEGGQTLVMVPVQENVLCLPDSVTVKIAPSGRLLGYFAENYLRYHCERDLSAFSKPIDLSSALPSETVILSQRNVILRSPGGKELYCVEADCESASGERAQICVNVNTGRQERILLEGERDPSVN